MIMPSIARLSLLFTLLLVFSQISTAESLKLKWYNKSESIVGYADFFEDKNRQYSFNDILSPAIQEKFNPLTKSNIEQGISNSSYWLKFTLYNPRENGVTWVIYPEKSYLDNMGVWVKTPQKKWFNAKKTDHDEFHRRAIHYRLLNASFRIKPKETTEVYVKLSSENIDLQNLNLYITGQSNLRDILAKEYMFYGMYYGLFLALILLIISIWIYAQTHNYTYYFYFLCYLSANILMWLSLNGFSFQFLWPKTPFIHNQSLHVLYLLVSGFGFLFSRQLLNTKEILPRIDKLILALIIIYFSAIVLRLFGIAYEFVFYTALFSLVSLIVQPLLALLCYKKGATYLVIYIIAWLPFSISMLLNISATITGWPNWDHLLFSQFSILFECLLLIIATLSKMRYRTDKLLQLTLQDPLTQLGNRRLLEEHVIALHKQHLPNKQYWLLLIDVDWFKKINDNHGHAVGDEVLVMLAKLLKKACRTTDIAIRWGGEEFVVLVSVEKAEIAFEVAERIRTKFEQTSFAVDQQTLSLSLSIGLNRLDFSLSDPLDESVKHADDALYQAKETGRNKSIIYIK